MRRARTILGVLATLALTATACNPVGATEETPPSVTTPEPKVTGTEGRGALVQFDACEAFLDHVASHAVDLVGPYGLEGGPGFWPAAGRIEDMEESADAGGEAAPSGFSETNVQVEGVDEPDMVKTDGNRIVLLAEGNLIVVDATGDEPVETGRLQLHDMSVQGLFLSGDTVLLFGSAWSHHPSPLAETADRAIAPVPSTPTVQVVEVNINDEPEIGRTMEIDGAFISGRMIEDSARLVISSGPVGFEWSYPEGSGLRAEREAIEENREIVRNSTEENWIPYFVVTDAEGNVTDEGTLFDCDRASHPEEFSGLDMLSVLSIDLGEGLEVGDATGMLATGDTVYASGESLYVATQEWQSLVWFETREDSDRPERPKTRIHRFDISEPDRTEYVASGSVDGYLLNQFAMDEHDGMLRIASTTAPSWWGSGEDSESRITVLRQIGDSMVRIGMIDGLGETERIYSVRFMGDVGYVVTFRQVDPLYTVDLSDPRDLEILGELKIPGYSAYLHPVGDGLLMGIGQDATHEGRVQGTQVSVFDVSDLSDPKRVDTHTLSEGTNSQVEYDHHAFLFWEGLAVVPVQQWRWDEETEEVFMGALALRVDDDGFLSLEGEVVHPGGEAKGWDGRSQILRSLVIDGSLYTVSHKGLLKSSLDGLGEEAWLDF